MKPLEDPTLGNWTSIVLLAAGLLNSAVAEEHRKTLPHDGAAGGGTHRPPNVAFHSDEGGRPAVYELDLPVVAFLPRASTADQRLRRPIAIPTMGTSDDHFGTTWSDPEVPWTDADQSRILLIEDVADFVDAVEYLLPYTTLLLNHGWLAHLLAVVDPAVNPDDLDDLPEDTQRFFARRGDDVEKLGAHGVDALRDQLRQLLIPVPTADLSVIGGDDADVGRQPGQTEEERRTKAFARQFALVQQQDRLFGALVEAFSDITRAGLGETEARTADNPVESAFDLVRRLLGIVDDGPQTQET
jgi:hypothetical protein